MKLPFQDISYYGKKEQNIGEGSYGVVYKTDKNYAIKRSRLSDDGNFEDSQIIEISTLKELSHPNIIKLFDVYLANERIYLIMELAEGSLQGYREENMQNLKIIAFQLVNGLNYIHSKDIIHGDIKPENILYRYDKYHTRVFYADFGLAKKGKCVSKILDPNVYTIWYRAPEILLGGNYNIKADVWALGMTIAHIYLGHPLITGYSEEEMLKNIYEILGAPTDETWPEAKNYPRYKHINVFPFRFSIFAYRLNKNDELATFLLKCLTLNPEKRANTYELYNDPFFDDIRDSFSSKLDKDNFFYVPKIKSLSCLDILTKAQEYPSLNSKSIYSKLRMQYNNSLLNLMKKYPGNRILSKAVYIVDKYISLKNIENDYDERENFQKYLICSFSLANLYYEGKPMNIYDINSIVKGKYSVDEIRDSIRNIAKTLNFDFYISTAVEFILVFRDLYSIKVHHTAIDLYQLSLLLNICFEFKPREIGLGILMLSCMINEETFRNNNLLDDRIISFPNAFFQELDAKKDDPIIEDRIKEIHADETENKYRRSTLKVA